MNSRGGLYQFGALLSLGSLVWYFKWGNKLSGWVGQTDAELQHKIKQIEEETEVVGAAPASSERYKKEAELSGKLIALLRKQGECRAATSELASSAILLRTPEAGLQVDKAVEAGPSDGKFLEVFPPHDPTHAPAVEFLKAYKGYRAIFLKCTETEQTAKLKEIMSHIDELKSIDAWFEHLKKMPVQERAPLRQSAEKTMERRVEILTRILRPF